MEEYSNKEISPKLLEEITQAVQSVQNFGSVEIFVQDGIVTQITVRTIRKTSAPRSKNRETTRKLNSEKFQPREDATVRRLVS